VVKKTKRTPKQLAMEARSIRVGVFDGTGRTVGYRAKVVRFFYGNNSWIDVVPQIDGTWYIRGLNPLSIELEVGNAFTIKERPF
jgi:hypothetical protein